MHSQNMHNSTPMAVNAKFAILVAVLVIALALAACQPQSGGTASLDSEEAKISYAIGLDIGQNLQAQNIEVDADVLGQGLRDVTEGNTPKLTDDEMRETMMAFQERLMAEQQEAMSGMAEANQAEQEAFLAEYAEREGVTKLESGLMYRVIEAGSGAKPTLESNVTVHYQGTFPDGEVFDSSIERGQPATFPVSGVIAGWTEALQLMEQGAKWELVIPSELGYGEQGAGQAIGPHQVLIFETELLEVN